MKEGSYFMGFADGLVVGGLIVLIVGMLVTGWKQHKQIEELEKLNQTIEAIQRELVEIEKEVNGS